MPNLILIGAKFPVFEGKREKTSSRRKYADDNGKRSAEQKAAWKFMKFLLSADSAEKWTKGTGYLPSAIQEKGTGIDKFLTENQLMNVASSQMSDMGKWASFSGSNGLKAEQILIDTRDIILSGEKPADKALEDAQNEIMNINEITGRYYERYICQRFNMCRRFL